MSKKYIHYGHDHFDINKFVPIRNQNLDLFAFKSIGGLWASPFDSRNGWYDFCIENDFRVDTLNKYFTFSLKNDAKILTVSSINDLINQDGTAYKESQEHLSYCYNEAEIDFEKLIELGYDGIEIIMCGDLYWCLYGWDVDALLIFNPEIIVI